MYRSHGSSLNRHLVSLELQGSSLKLQYRILHRLPDP